jgi:hypothetical protein
MLAEKLHQPRAWQKTRVSLLVLGTRSPLEPCKSWLWPDFRSATKGIFKKVSNIHPSWKTSLTALDRTQFTMGLRKIKLSHVKFKNYLHSPSSIFLREQPWLAYLTLPQIVSTHPHPHIKSQSSYIWHVLTPHSREMIHSQRHATRYHMLLLPIYSEGWCTIFLVLSWMSIHSVTSSDTYTCMTRTSTLGPEFQLTNQILMNQKAWVFQMGALAGDTAGKEWPVERPESIEPNEK